jgi:hypothetical protein
MATPAATKKAEEPQLPALAGNEDAFTAALREAGFLSPASAGSDFHRVKLDGQNLTYEGEVIGSYNAKTKEPALYIRLAGEATEYQAAWISEALAIAIDRPALAKKMCKSHFNDPNEARKMSDRGYSCDTCPIHPLMPKTDLPPEADEKRCSWKADIDFYILEKQTDGTLKQVDETLYTMSLATTAVIEYKGSGGNKTPGAALKGSVSPENFKVQLAKLGMAKWGEKGILMAKTYEAAGGVIAEVHILRGQSPDGSRSYPVVSLKPIDILEMEEAPALPDTSGAAEDDEPPF